MSDLFEDDIRGRKAKEERIALPGGKQHTSNRRLELMLNGRGVSQVVVKVTGYTQSRSGATANARYIMRQDTDEKEDVPIETRDGLILEAKADVDAVLDDWFAAKETRKDARRTANIVLSAPEGSDRAAVTNAVREFATDFFGDNHDYFFAMHEDTSNPHAHLTVKTRGFDQKQLRLGKAQLHAMREGFASKLRSQGVIVGATYRSDRGNWKKSEKQTLRHMRAEAKPVRVDAPERRSALSQAVRDLPMATDWESAMQERYKLTKAEYRALVEEMAASPDKGERAAAQVIAKYAETLPSPPNSAAERSVGQEPIQKAPPDRGFER